MMERRMIAGVVAWFAVASAACGTTATNPWPPDFATVDTHTTTMKEFLSRKSKASTAYASGGMFFAYSSTGSDSKPPADYRAAFGEDYKVNGIVKLSWKGTSGESIVTVTRLSDGDVRTFTTTGTSVEFLAPEIGRNYKWTVRNGGTVSGPWYFYTDGEAPRIIPQSLAVVGNCRDMGGWVTTDGKWRVRQGLGYRNDHNADFVTYEQLKPFWTDVAKIKTDMDLRDKANSTQWYCNYELDSNANHPGRSPYGQHWWSVWYWNVLREGDYGAVMNAYKALVDKIGASPASADSKKASANTWKCLADAQYLPVVVHCSQGRDRTGTLAFVLLGALGVGLNDLYADWALTDYAAPKDFPKSTAEEGGSTIVTLYNALVAKYPNGTYPTLQDKCVKLLQDMGVSDAQLANLKSYWLEPVEEKLTAAPGGTSVTVPVLSKSRVTKTESAQKPTVAASSHYTVDYGGGDYKNYGKYLVTVTLKDSTTTKWADGTIGPKVLPFIIEHAGNVVQANVLSFIQGDTSPHIRIARPRYLGEVTCDYTEAQLNALAPGDYTATFTPKACELASASKAFTCKFTVYPNTEKAAYTYEYADLKSAFFKTDYVPTIQTDKIEVRMMDQTDGEGYAPFSSGPYPASLSIMKMSGGVLRYHQGAQRVDNDPGTWTVNKIYKLTAQGKTISHTDEATQKTVTKSISALDAVKPTPGTAYIGCSVDKTANMGAEGTPGYHQPHRLYHVKAWANGTSLIHEFVPCKTTGGYAMLYDKVTKKVYPFSHTCKNTGTVTLGGTATPVGGDDDPDPGPTPDTRAVTYTWKGGTGLWAETANWTPGTGATFGYPNHATYATADFPVTLTEATACTITSGVSVKNALFGSPNLTLTIDNATLTVTDWISDGRIGAYNFGDTMNGNPMIEFSGAKAALVASRNSVRSNFGCVNGAPTGFCTVSFVVPETGWGSVAPIRAAGNDAKVCFWNNVKFDIDARALGTPAAGIEKRVLLASSTDGVCFYGADLETTLARSTIACAQGATAEVMLDGNRLVLAVTGCDDPQPEPQPEPEPTPSTRFDAAHTIVCYGDSLTWGASAAEITMDDRANYHDGRLAGVTAVPQGYPYWLSGMVTDCNVINQSRSGSQTCNITSWSGEQRVDVKCAFTLPALGSVSVATNFVFNNGPWGEWGGWASTEGQTDRDVFDRWAGFVTPIFPLMEPYDEAKTRYSVTGTLAGRHVRLAGLHPTNITVTVFGEGAAQEIAPGTQFIPDAAETDLYKNAIRIICAGGNDANDKTIGERYDTYIRPLLQAFAAKGGKYLIVSPSVNMGTASGTAATAVEQRMDAEFGDHYLNLRQKVVTEGKATAESLGVPFTGKWDATDGTGLKGLNDTVHFSEKGYKVMAEFIRQKLVALGYVENVPQPEPPPPVVDPTAYGAADTKAATYTWKGGSGPWNFTTNWTPSASATYGIPNQKTYATADFPATLTETFVCTVSNNMTVKFALFDAPNMKLVLDNASLTCNDRIDTAATWGAYNFGNTATGSPMVEFRGAKAALVTTKQSVRANFGYLGDGDATGVCTVRFVVPATGWEKTAPIRTGKDSKVIFKPNVRIEVDATALGVPNEGVTNRVLLASSTDGLFQNGTTSVTCATGAHGWVAIDGDNLVLSVVAGRDYPPWIGDTDETSKAKYDVWAEAFGVSDPSAARNDAYLLNCANTDAAIEEAKAAFKITGITIGSDGKVTVDTSKAGAGDFNGKVEIGGAKAVDGSYDLPEGSPDARFFKAFLRP